MSYQTFTEPEELPEERLLTVVLPAEDDEDAILIGPYQNGDFLEEPTYIGPAEVTDHVGNYIVGDVYVHEEAGPAFELAQVYSRIYDLCEGNLSKISEMLDEGIEASARQLEEFLE